MDLDLRLVRYFRMVGDELHFGRAAARLFISQPALSKQIRKLEDQLGAQLLVRDSRHVELTPRGEKFLSDARELIDLAERMQRPTAPNVVRIAHIFELTTSRIVADAFAEAFPDVQLVERSQDSYRQLQALLTNQLDVAILRVTTDMLASHPTGWRHRPLRLEPMLLVGRAGDPPRPTASLYERPIEVFADPPESGMYNAHGEYMTALESSELPLRWLGNPGTFNNCLATVRRAPDPAYVLEFESYVRRYTDTGIATYAPEEFRPYFPWSIAWRDEDAAQPVADFISVAERTGRDHQWHQHPADRHPAVPHWVPPDNLSFVDNLTAPPAANRPPARASTR